jgi:F-type H+-transporting ATPase subunit epsilon
MLNNHAPVVSTLKGGTVRINGAITIEDAVKDKFTQDGADVNLFSITSGTVEMRNNKLILLAD